MTSPRASESWTAFCPMLEQVSKHPSGLAYRCRAAELVLVEDLRLLIRTSLYLDISMVGKVISRCTIPFKCK